MWVKCVLLEIIYHSIITRQFIIDKIAWQYGHEILKFPLCYCDFKHYRIGLGEFKSSGYKNGITVDYVPVFVIFCWIHGFIDPNFRGKCVIEGSMKDRIFVKGCGKQ